VATWPQTTLQGKVIRHVGVVTQKGISELGRARKMPLEKADLCT